MVAPDLRAHGADERRPTHLSLDAFVSDALVFAHRFEEPPVVIGQSLGGRVATALAARHPEAVRALVLIESGPEPDPGAAGRIKSWLDSWPVPFASREAAADFFGGGEAGRAWAAGLAERGDGVVPAFDPDVVERVVAEIVGPDGWDDWRAVRCPALVVRGGRGSLGAEEADRMARENPRARTVIVEGAGHDVHLDDPAALRALLEQFLG